MCYSAQIQADYKKLVRTYGAVMSLEDFAKLYFHDPSKARPKAPKAMDDGFLLSDQAEVAVIAAEIREWNQDEAARWQEQLFAQKTRLNTAERAPYPGRIQRAGLPAARRAALHRSTYRHHPSPSVTDGVGDELL